MTRRTLGLAGTAGVIVIAGVLAASGAFAAGGGSARTSAPAATAVSVIAGKPVEFAMQLSRTTIRPGPVVFTVQNKGTQRYAFEVCWTSGHADVCEGARSITLYPGQTTKLATSLKKGMHEFILSTDDYVTMKGILEATPKAAIGKTTAPGKKPVKPGTSTTPGTSGSSGGTGTKPSTKPGTSPGSTGSNTPGTAPAGGATLVGDPTAGATVFRSSSCGSCHTMSAAGSAGAAGPNLDQIAPDQQTVVTNVTFGNPMGMPAFGGPGGSLTTKQINDVAAYVYASTHSTAH